jgi:hypothetical protein
MDEPVFESLRDFFCGSCVVCGALFPQYVSAVSKFLRVRKSNREKDDEIEQLAHAPFAWLQEIVLLHLIKKSVFRNVSLENGL